VLATVIGAVVGAVAAYLGVSKTGGGSNGQGGGV